jgi:Transglutaminase-like superfamily
MTALTRQLDHLLADTDGVPAPPPVSWRLRLHAVRRTIRALRLLKTRGWGPAHRYHQSLHPGPGWQTIAALEPRTAILLVRREVLFSQLVLRAMAPHALCLPRALALGVYLSALGLPAEVVVARERAPIHPRYSFHAWTELYGDVVNDRPEVQIGHSVLQRVSTRFPPAGRGDTAQMRTNGRH